MNKPLIADMQEKFNSAEGTKEAVIIAFDSYNEYVKGIEKKAIEDINKQNKNTTLQMPSTEEIKNGVERLIIDNNLEGR